MKYAHMNKEKINLKKEKNKTYMKMVNKDHQIVNWTHHANLMAKVYLLAAHHPLFPSQPTAS
jgi:hypothetical protein